VAAGTVAGGTGSTLRNGLGRALYEAKTVVAAYPAVALPIARWRRRNYPLEDDTEIVIEGFPRSALTFAVAAFQRAQDRKLRIAHHVHAPAQVIAATRRKIPALVVIREPEEAVLSFVIREPVLTLRAALRGYGRFYAPLVRHRGGFVVATFDEVTIDFGRTIERINAAFGTEFRRFEHTPENVRACLERIEATARRNNPPQVLERIVARPSEVRDRLKAALRSRYREPRLAGLRARAEDLYERMTAGHRS
jgi:hypothetical protein